MDKYYLLWWYQKKIDELKEAVKDEKDFAKREYVFREIAVYEEAIGRII